MVDGRTDDADGRTPARWVYLISSPCEPNSSGELIKEQNKSYAQLVCSVEHDYFYYLEAMCVFDDDDSKVIFSMIER